MARGFFAGRLTQARVYGTFSTQEGHHHFDLTTENDYGNLPEGDFIERLHPLRWTWSFNPDIVLSLFTQYQVGSGNVGWNARLRWTLKPGNDFYVVRNRHWVRVATDAGERFDRDSDPLIRKPRWTLRK